MSPPLFLGAAVLVIPGADGPGRCVRENESLGALGVRGGEERTRLAAFTEADERYAVGRGRIQDRADVIHAGLQWPQVTGPVGETGSPLVEDDDAGERRQALVEPSPVRVRPREDEVAELGYEHEIMRAVAERLVRNRDIAAPCVLDLGNPHTESVPLHWSQWQRRRSKDTS